MEVNPNRAEAERLLGIAQKLLHGRDLHGSRDFAVLAQEAEPLLDGSDQILAVIDVLLAAEKRLNNQHDWYAILQIERRSEDPDLIKKQYRKLALLLHPDKNNLPFADHAFKLVADAWSVLSDSSRKPLYDGELNLFSKVDLGGPKLPVRRSRSQPQEAARKPGPGARTNHDSSDSRMSSFWTACPYCYNLFEYPRVYQDCCLKCQTCKRSFHAALVPSLPPLVPGQEAYYCCWGTFPIGYVMGNSEGKPAAPAAPGGFPNWMPPMFSNGTQEAPSSAAPAKPAEVREEAVEVEFHGGAAPAKPAQVREEAVEVEFHGGAAPAKPAQVREGAAELPRGTTPVQRGQKKKRGRPRKYPLNA